MYSEPNTEGATWWNNTPVIAGANFLHSRKLGNWDLTFGGNLNYDHGYMGAPVQDSLIEALYPDTLSRFSEKQMVSRSEERRVGKECRSRWARDDEKKKIKSREWKARMKHKL